MAISNKGYNTTNFVVQLNGQAGGYLTSFTAPTYEADKITMALGPDGVSRQMTGKPKLGEFKWVFNIAEAGPMWDLMDAVIKKNCQEFEAYVGLADQDYKIKRGIAMQRCLIKELSANALDAKDGKGLMEITMSGVCEGLAYEGAGDVIKANMSMKAKGWPRAMWEPIGLPGGILPQSITKIDLCKYTAKIAEEHVGMHRLPTRHYAAWEVAGLKTEISAIGFDAAKDLCVKVLHDGEIQETDFVDWSVNIKAHNNKTQVGEVVFIQTAPQKFTWAGELKGGTDQMAVSTIEWLCENQFWKITHK